jgi:hypothetical protein
MKRSSGFLPGAGMDLSLGLLGPFFIALIVFVLTWRFLNKKSGVELPPSISPSPESVANNEPVEKKVSKARVFKKGTVKAPKGDKKKDCCSTSGGCCSNKEKLVNVNGNVEEIVIFYGTESGSTKVS